MVAILTHGACYRRHCIGAKRYVAVGLFLAMWFRVIDAVIVASLKGPSEKAMLTAEAKVMSPPAKGKAVIPNEVLRGPSQRWYGACAMCMMSESYCHSRAPRAV